MDTQQDSIYSIFTDISAWPSNTPFETDPSAIAKPNLQLEFGSQLMIGREPMLCGLISSKLVEYQQEQYTLLESKKIGTRWGINSIMRMRLLIQKH